MTSVVYFIQSAEGPIKIGYTSELGRRRANLATPEGLGVVLASIRGGPDLEGHIHSLLAEHRMHGEWFRPHASVLELARAIADNRYRPPAGMQERAGRETSRRSLAKAIEDCRDEARLLVGTITGPKVSGSFKKDMLPPVARATGIPVSRLWDIWYRKAATIQAAEMDRLRAAANLARRTSRDPDRLRETMRDLLSQLESVIAALEDTQQQDKESERIRRLTGGV